MTSKYHFTIEFEYFQHPRSNWVFANSRADAFRVIVELYEKLDIKRITINMIEE